MNGSIEESAGSPHVYLSTGCLHGRHDYCQSAHVGRIGSPIQHWTKQPASCKFCAAPCVCPCHEYTIPIESGLVPQHGMGALSKERAADLAHRLRQLQTARQRAWAEIRTPGPWVAVDREAGGEE